MGSFLIAQAQKHRPQQIVELGSGVSTLILGSIAKTWGGQVLSFEQDLHFAKITQERLDRFGLHNVQIRLAPLTDRRLLGETWKWYDLDPETIERPIDFLFIDGPPAYIQKLSRFPALPILKDKLTPSAVIILDDADRGDEKNVLSRWLKAFPQLRLLPFAPESEAGIALLHWEIEAPLPRPPRLTENPQEINYLDATF
ncbi:MAG: class I SAM-dependent methyltransferase [Bdellovibrionota bacterium]